VCIKNEEVSNDNDITLVRAKFLLVQNLENICSHRAPTTRTMSYEGYVYLRSLTRVTVLIPREATQ
jgi:hypothetical protein